MRTFKTESSNLFNVDCYAIFKYYANYISV